MYQTYMSGIESKAVKSQVKATEAKKSVVCRTMTPQLTGGKGTPLTATIHLRVCPGVRHNRFE